MITMTDEETERRERAVWQAPRRPVVIAAALIAATTALLWGVRSWGVANPELTVWSSDYDVHGGTVRLVVENHSRSWVTVEAATLARFEQQTTTVLERPVDVAPLSSATIDAALPNCPAGLSSGVASVDASVTARTAVGRTTDATAAIAPLECASRLPPAGEQPDDPVAARDAVTQAFWTVYDSERTPEDRLAAIADPRDIEALTTMAASGPAGALMAASKSGVTEIVFDRPDHAWVEYDVVSTAGSGPAGTMFTTIGGLGPGEAVLVDGTWKVARSTVCNDLARASVTCPP